MATFNINDIAGKVETAKAAVVSEGFKPLESGIYKGIITEFGVYENKFGNNSVFTEVTIPVDGADDRVLSISKGLALKNGDDNEGTLSFLKEVFAATGVEIKDSTTGTSTIKDYGSEYQLTSFKDCYNKSVSVFVRETFEEGAKYDKGNIVTGIYSLENKNSAGEDQAETFNKTIAEKPILIKASKKKAATTVTDGATSTGSSAASRL